MRHRGSLLRSLKPSGEVAAHGTIRSIIGLDRVALAGFDRADERSRQYHLPGFQCQPVRCDLVGKPGHRCRRMVENAGCKPGLLELAVAEAERTDPAKVSVHRPDRAAAEHDTGICGIVSDGVENL